MRYDREAGAFGFESHVFAHGAYDGDVGGASPKRFETIEPAQQIETPRKFYAVLRGRHSGIYKSWPECREQVHGFSGARYKGFGSQAEVERFLGLL
jgi:hypothetical protein